MGGRGGSGGVKTPKSKYELNLRSHFNVVDYGGKAYAKVGGGWGVYDFSHKPKSGKDADYLINVAKTAKGAREIIEKWNAALKRERKRR